MRCRSGAGGGVSVLRVQSAVCRAATSARYVLFCCCRAAVGFSFDPDTLFVDAGKRCSSCGVHTSMPYPGHRRVLVFLGLIVLRRGGVNVYVHAVAGLPCCAPVAVGACVVEADGGALRLVDEP